MSNPRFTFCIPNLNKIDYLPACIESVLAQDCPDWKCVFVDGYSTDGSWEYMQQFADDPRFEIRRGIKQGMYADWNECLRRVETEYFYIMTSDDTCFPELVSTTVNALDQYPNIDACHFQFCLIDAAGQICKTHDAIVKDYFELYSSVNHQAHRRSGLCEFMMHFVYQALYMSMTSLVFRNTLIKKLGGFKTTYAQIGDFDWTMRMSLLTDVLYIPKLLATWRTYEEQATQQAQWKQAEILRLAVAKDNLNAFLKTEKAQTLKRPVNPNQLLGNFHRRHAAALLAQARSSSTTGTILKNLFTFLVHYPTYIPRRTLNQLSFNRIWPYPDMQALPQQLIRDYGLDWKPKAIEIESIFPA